MWLLRLDKYVTEADPKGAKTPVKTWKVQGYLDGLRWREPDHDAVRDAFGAGRFRWCVYHPPVIFNGARRRIIKGDYEAFGISAEVPVGGEFMVEAIEELETDHEPEPRDRIEREAHERAASAIRARAWEPEDELDAFNGNGNGGGRGRGMQDVIADTIRQTTEAMNKAQAEREREREWQEMRLSVKAMPSAEKVQESIAAAKSSADMVEKLSKQISELRKEIGEARAAAEAAQKEASKPLREKLQDWREVFEAVNEVQGGGGGDDDAGANGVAVMERIFSRVMDSNAASPAAPVAPAKGTAQPQAGPSVSDWETSFGGEFRVLGPVLDELMADLAVGVPPLHATDSAMYKLYPHERDADRWGSEDANEVAEIIRQRYPAHSFVQRHGLRLGAEFARMQEHYRKRRAELQRVANDRGNGNAGAAGPQSPGDAGGNAGAGQGSRGGPVVPPNGGGDGGPAPQ